MSDGARILDGAALARTIRRQVATDVERLVASGGRPPRLAAVLVGDDPASKIYVRHKAKACAEVGIDGRTITPEVEVDTRRLIALVDDLNADPEVDGILVQLPLPRHLDSARILDAVDPAKDVDGFHPVNVGRLWQGRDGFRSATPAGIMELLRRSDVPLEGADAVVVGRSDIVGKPMAAMLLAANCTVTVCHSRTRDLQAVCRRADILVAAVGRAAMIGSRHVKPGATVVDVGINRLGSREDVERLFPGDEAKLARLDERGSLLVGDVDFDRVAEIAGAITPVPGGVGPLTIAMLLVNTVEAARGRE